MRQLRLFILLLTICSSFSCAPKIVYRNVGQDEIVLPKAEVYRLMDESTRLKIELKRCLEEKDKQK